MAADSQVLYVTPDTMGRLLATKRVVTTFTDGVARTFFSRTDDTYPDATVLLSREITPNAVHRRTWIPAEERHVFEYVGNV